MSCGEDAAFTKRLEANDKRIEVIGGSDKYMAVCRNCWHSNKEKGIFSRVTSFWSRSSNAVFDT